MGKNILFDEEVTRESHLTREILKSLKEIQDRLEHELTVKEKQIDICYQEIKALQKSVEEKNFEIKEANVKLAECQRNNEGNRQIINKLLNDLERKQQDIDWYKRTYESRSFLGTIREKLFRVKRK